MDEDMARLILGAKLRELDGKLESKNIHLEYTDEVKIEMLRLGYSPEYGAREMERVIGNQIKPLIVNEILFGSLASGGSAVLDFIDGRFTVSVLQNDVRFSLGERLKTLFTRPAPLESL
jgi:ATP-dependent Clp protease ATP-binding subunit ClpA